MVLVSVNAERNGKVKEMRKRNSVHLITQHASPHHQRSTTKLQSSSTSLSFNPSPAIFEATSSNLTLACWFLSHLTIPSLPIIHSPMLVLQSKVHPLLPMPVERSGFFSSPQPSYQLSSGCWTQFGQRGLVDDAGKGFGDINSSRSLSRTNKTDYMRILVEESIEGQPPTGLERWSGFRVKPRDSTNTMTSRRCYVGSRMTSIKHRKVLVLLGKWKSAHGRNGELLVLEPLYLYSRMI